MFVDLAFILGAAITLGLRLVVGKKLRLGQRRIDTALPLFLAGWTYAMLVFVKDTLAGHQVAYVSENVSLTVQLITFALMLLWLSDILDSADLVGWAAKREPVWGVPAIVTGACYAVGVLLFNYSSSQYLVAAAFLLFGVACVITDVYPGQKPYKVAVILLMVVAAVFHYLMPILVYGEPDFPALSATVRRFPFIAFVLLFTLIQGARHAIFSARTIKALTKTILTVSVAGFVYNHPEFNDVASRVVKEIVAWTPVGVDSTIAAFAMVRVLLARQTAT